MTGGNNAGCASGADIVLVAVPWEGHEELLTSLRSKLIQSDSREYVQRAKRAKP